MIFVAHNSKTSKEVFFWMGLEIHQDNLVHKIGTDAILLGAWIPKIIEAPGHILDVGTGTGILALIMARQFPGASIKAIDVDKQAVQLAKKNIAKSGFRERIDVEKKDILQKSSDQACNFDLVISNPPFYNTNNPSKSEYKKLARHCNVPIKDWMYSLLDETVLKGHCFIIVPTHSASEWISSANEKGFYNADRLDVYSFEKNTTAVRSLLHFSKDLLKPTISKLNLYQKDNTYTDHYLQFTGIAVSNNKDS